MRWRLHNREGKAVDPVPFLVVSLAAFIVTHGWGPIYLGYFGVSTIPMFAILTTILGGIVGLAYYRFVWSARPDEPRVASAQQRLSFILYAIAIGIGLILLLALPFLR